MRRPKTLLREAAAECGWDELTQIEVLCDFIAQASKAESNFKKYLDQRVNEELDAYNTEYDEFYN